MKPEEGRRAEKEFLDRLIFLLGNKIKGVEITHSKGSRFPDLIIQKGKEIVLGVELKTTDSRKRRVLKYTELKKAPDFVRKKAPVLFVVLCAEDNDVFGFICYEKKCPVEIKKIKREDLEGYLKVAEKICGKNTVNKTALIPLEVSTRLPPELLLKIIQLSIKRRVR